MMTAADVEPKTKRRAPAKERLSHIKPRHLNAGEAAFYLGISVFHLHRLREKHPLYRPDVRKPNAQSAGENVPEKSKTSKKPHGQKDQDPLWSKELLDFISFAWGVPQDGPQVRELEDDEAYELWTSMREEERKRFQKKAGY